MWISGYLALIIMLKRLMACPSSPDGRIDAALWEDAVSLLAVTLHNPASVTATTLKHSAADDILLQMHKSYMISDWNALSNSGFFFIFYMSILRRFCVSEGRKQHHLSTKTSW